MKATILKYSYMKGLFLRPFVFIYLAILNFASLQSSAQGDLRVYPKRIVFEGAKKSQELNLANSGKDTARYVLSVVQIRMKELRL